MGQQINNLASTVSDLGLRGLIVETVEPAHSLACSRYEALQIAIQGMSTEGAGARVLITAIAEGLILAEATLTALRGVGKLQLYSRGPDFEVEIDMGDGWRDRRLLPTTLVEAIRENRGQLL